MTSKEDSPESTEKFLENLSKKDFRKMPVGTRVRSKDGKFIVVRKKLCWEIFCLSRKKPNRHMEVVYNLKPLKKLFGEAPNMYNNMLDPLATAGGHFHKKINEIFINVSSGPITIKLIDPDSGDMQAEELSSELTTIEKEEYARILMIPKKIGHLVINNSHSEKATLTVITSGQHKDNDVHNCEF